MSTVGGDITARLFLDETGQFSEPSQMRLVGGLLVVTRDDPSNELANIHARAARHIGWPVRLHALELSKLGYMLLWYATGGLGITATRHPANTQQQFVDVLKTHPPPTPAGPGFTWTKAARRFASGAEPQLRKHLRAKSIAAVGRTLRAALQECLASEFRAWCSNDRAAYMIAGHVDDAQPPGLRSYLEALNAALEVACRTAATMHATKVIVTIADPHLGSAEAILEGIAPQQIPVDARIVEYDAGPPGLWLADSLLSWCRPIPGAYPTPLDLEYEVSRCLVAATTSSGQHQSADTFGKFLRAVEAASGRMAK